MTEKDRGSSDLEQTAKPQTDPEIKEDSWQEHCLEAKPFQPPKAEDNADMDRIRNELEKFSSSLLAAIPNLPNLSTKDAEKAPSPQDSTEVSENPQKSEETDHPEGELNQQQEAEEVSRGTQSKLDFEILNMKAQHQYIQNLQRANMALKSKIKQLEDILAKEESEPINSETTVDQTSEQVIPNMVPAAEPAQITTQADIGEQETEESQIQEMELVPIGKIEDVARKEI